MHWKGIGPIPLENDLDTLRGLRLFARVLDLGSISGAAREAGLGQPTVSKVISGLEHSIGVRLLERSTTRLAPTEEGRRLYARSRMILDEYAETLADVRGQAQSISGPLSINAPVGLGELHINRLILAFAAQHPGIEVELILNDRAVDLVEEGVDVAIRLGGALPADVIAREVGSSARVLVATAAYLAQAPALRKPEDLGAHEYVRYAGLASGSAIEFFNSSERRVVRIRGRFRVNNSCALREALLQGAGVGSAPAWLVQDLIESGKLVRVLPKWRMSGQSLHLLYPSRRYQPRRVRAALQYLAAELPKLPGIARR